MADKKISALTAASTPLAGTEVLPIVQGASTVKVAVSDLTAGRAVSATSVAAGLGAVGTPAYTFTGDTNTGLWSPAADTIAFSEGGVEAMRITSAGDIGVATTTPGAKLDVNGNVGIGVPPNGTWGTAALGFGKNGAGNPTYPFIASINSQGLWAGSNARWDGTDWKYQFSAASVTAAAILVEYNQIVIKRAVAGSAGSNITWLDAFTFNDTGNLVVGTANKGIDFSANTGAPGMTSELLDWYEEGNWTPTVSCLTSGTVTLSPSEGFYTKIGRLVHVSARFTVDSVASPNGIASIDGLPFVSANNNNASSAASLYLNGFGAGATPFVMGSIDLNSSSIYLFQFVAGNRVNTMANQFQAGARLYLSATYVAAV